MALSIGRRFALSTFLSVIDQGLVSSVNLIVGLFFIAFGDKTDYGTYAQLFALIMLSQSIQNALINAPWVTLAPRYRRRRSRALSAHLFRLQTIVSAVVGGASFICLLGATYALDVPAINVGVALAFASLLPGQWLREFARDFFFLRLQPERSIVVYVIFASSTLFLLSVAALANQINSVTVLGILAIACWSAGGWGMRRAQLSPCGNHGHSRSALTAAWAHSRWTLPGVIVTWAYSNAHLFIAASMMGVYASADLAASKLLIMPAGICVLGWSNIFLPNVSHWISARDFDRIQQVLWRSLYGLWAIIALYMAMVWGGYGFLVRFLLSDKYTGLLPLVAIWGGYFMINAAVMGNTWILAAAGEYRLLFLYDCAIFIITIPIMAAGTYLFGTPGTLASLLIAQAGQLLLTNLHGIPKVKHKWAFG